MAYGYVAAKIAAHTAHKNGIPARKFRLPRTRVGDVTRWKSCDGWTITYQGPEGGENFDLLVNKDGTISDGNEESSLYRELLAKYKNYAAAVRAIEAGDLDAIAVKSLHAERAAWARGRKASSVKSKKASSKRFRQEAELELEGPSAAAEDAFFTPWYER